MFVEGRGLAARWSWLLGGACGVLLLLLVVCYCRLMPRHHHSLDEQYLKENHTIREDHVHSGWDSCRVQRTEVQRHARPSSYAGAGDARRPPAPPRPPRAAPPAPPPARPAHPAPGDRDPQQQAQRDHYASITLLEEAAEARGGAEALRTRSLPAFLRPRPRARPLSDAAADYHLLYSKVSVSKNHKNRMRSEHAAVIALSKSRGQLPAHDCDVVIVYDQRTRL